MIKYSDHVIGEMINDYRHDFGVQLSVEDAVRMMILTDMLSEVFEKYEDEAGQDMPAFVAPLLGF